MSSVEARSSKDVVARFMRGDLAVLDDDAAIWLAARIPVPPSSSTRGGFVTKAQLVAMMARLGELGTSRYRIEVVGMTAESGRVAVEAAGHIDLATGGVYDNRYHIVFEVEGDRITQMREYSDTRLVAELFDQECVDPVNQSAID